MNPLVSVIIPVYNVENYLKKCLNSVINQTYKNLEIILVDDGSPDNCGKICDEYAANDERVKVYHKENGGLSSARNIGIDIATGEYLFFIDSDDWITYDCIECLYDSLLNHNSDCSVTAALFVYESNNTELRRHNKKKENGALSNIEAINSAFYADRFDVSVCGKLFKNKLLATIRFPEGKNHEDADIIYKLFYLCGSVSYIGEAKYYYLKRKSGNITTSISTIYATDVIEISEKALDYIKLYIPQCYVSCLHYLVSNQLFAALKITPKSIEEKECVKHIELNIKKYRSIILRDKNASFRVRCACFASCFGFGFVRLLYELYKRDR